MPAKVISTDAKGFLKKNLWGKHSEVGGLIFLIRLSLNKTLWNKSDNVPVLIKTFHTSSNGNWNGDKFYGMRIQGKLFLFKNALFDVTGLFTQEEAKLLVLEKFREERREIEFLESGGDSSSRKRVEREHIPERIRHEVWRRDGGKCVECGSDYKLEFDHIIPVAKGGSHTARNLRILCEPCNRRKSDNIG